MGFIVTMFVSVVLAVFSMVSSGSAEAKTVTKNGVSYSCDYECSNRTDAELVRQNACRPQSLPPSFRSPVDSQIVPSQIMPSQIPDVGSDLKNAIGGIFGLIVCICAGVVGGFSGYRQEKAKDDLIAEAEAAKEKQFAETHSAKLAAAKAAAAAK